MIRLTDFWVFVNDGVVLDAAAVASWQMNQQERGYVMSEQRKVPDDQLIIRWFEEGLTQQQMAQRHKDETGVDVSRSAIGYRIQRLGLDSKQRSKYAQVIPWRLKRTHDNSIATNLRSLRAVKHGEELTPKRKYELELFLERLNADDAVIGYSPSRGLTYVRRTTVPANMIDEEYPIIKPEP